MTIPKAIRDMLHLLKGDSFQMEDRYVIDTVAFIYYLTGNKINQLRRTQRSQSCEYL